MITCFFMTVKHIARIILGGQLTGTRQMVPVWMLADENPPFLEHLSGDQCCYSMSLTLLTDLRERCVTGNMSIYWSFFSCQESPLWLWSEWMWFRAGHQAFPPSSLGACHKHGVDESVHKMPNSLQCGGFCILTSFHHSHKQDSPWCSQERTLAVRKASLPLAKFYGLELQEDAESPLCSLPKYFMSVVEQRKPSLLWLNLWYLQ